MITQANVAFMWDTVVNPRLGCQYAWGGSFDPNNTSVGTDCSGAVSACLEALINGPQMVWARQFWTGTFTGAAAGSTGPYGGVAITAPLVCVASLADVPADAAMIIAVKQDPDPSNAHMVCQVGGVGIEMGGNSNDFHTGAAATPVTDPMFGQHFYLPGPIVNQVQGVDYSGGRPGGASIKGRGYSFACRYVFDGAPFGTPFKMLTAAEAQDLQANGVDIVSNWESSANAALGGFNQGVADAQAANANHLAAGGPPGRPIYFSVDYDAPETDQPAIDAYFQGVASVIGVSRTGVYGGYWVVKRCLDAGVVTWAWQTEAWSSDPAGLAPVGQDGDYLDPRTNILQRNAAGFVNINGVECDVDEALTADYGQWNYTGGLFMSLSPQQEQDVYTWLGDLHGASFNPVTSQSPFRALGEGAIWTTKDLPHNDDGFIHPGYVEHFAVNYNHPYSMAVLEHVASGDPVQFPDRADDIALAKKVLAKVAAPAPAPLVHAAPVVPAPAPAPSKPVINPLTNPPMTYLHSLTSWLGGALAIGTWVVGHNIFSTPVAAGISSGIVALTGLFNYLVKEEQSS